MDGKEHQEQASNARAAVRTNMFVAAVLQGEDRSYPVKIRNMSPAGALLEGPVLPSPETVARLLRGSLATSCTVVWRSGKHAGVALSPAVSVRDWLASPANKDQQKIDEFVRLVQAGASPQSLVDRRDLGSAPAVEPALISEDLRRVVEILKSLGEDLAGTDATVSRHWVSLQHLDIVVQTISVLAATVTRNEANPLALARLDDLRKNCQRALESARR